MYFKITCYLHVGRSFYAFQFYHFLICISIPLFYIFIFRIASQIFISCCISYAFTVSSERRSYSWGFLWNLYVSSIYPLSWFSLIYFISIFLWSFDFGSLVLRQYVYFHAFQNDSFLKFPSFLIKLFSENTLFLLIFWVLFSFSYWVPPLVSQMPFKKIF